MAYAQKTSVLRPFRHLPALIFKALPLALASVSLTPVPCLAQSTGQTGSIELQATQFQFQRPEEEAKKRDSSDLRFWISRQDCLDDEKYGGGETKIVTNPRLSPVGNRYRFEIWVSQGADCTKSDERGPNGNCWNVYFKNPSISVEYHDLFPRDILAGRGGDPSDPNICDKEVEWPTVFYYLLSEGDNLLASTTWDQTQVDTKGPLPPSTITAAGGDARIYVDWRVEDTDVSGDTEGFGLFCFPNGTVVPIGTIGAAGAAGAASTEESCEAAGFVPGALPNLDDLCGRAPGLTSTGASTDPSLMTLMNGTSYAIAVASTDRVGNLGRLSIGKCATPEPVIGFFEQYKAAGGKGGRGSCGLGGSPTRTQTWLLLLFGALGALLIQRRRARRSW